jgi:hypothetical protein
MSRKALLLLAIVFVVCHRAAYAGIYGQADVSYYRTETVVEDSETGDSETSDSFTLTHSYTLGLSKAFTSTLTLSADIRYSVSETEEGTTENLYPLFYLSYAPPSIYYVTFSYHRTESPAADNPTTSTSMNGTFILPLKEWPQLSVTLSRGTTQDYLSPHEVDNSNYSAMLKTDYTFSYMGARADLGYTFTGTFSDDNVGKSTSTSFTHTMTGNASRSFMKDKLRTDASVGVSFLQTGSETEGDPTRFEQELPFSEVLYLEDTDPATGTMTSTPALSDNTTATSAGLDLNGSYRNIGFGFSSEQTIGEINLYVSTAETGMSGYVGDFGWQLYTSSDGFNWTYVESPSAEWDSAYSRVVFTPSTDMTARYFKVVNTTYQAGLAAIYVTEIEAIQYVLETPSSSYASSSTRQFGGFGVSYVPNQKVNAKYSLTFDRSAYDLYDYVSLTVGQSVNLSYLYHPTYLSVSTGVTLSDTVNTYAASGDVTTLTAAYTLGLASSPLPTVNANLSYGLSTTQSGDTSDTLSNSVSTTAYLKLYRGLNVGVSAGYALSNDAINDTTTGSTSLSANAYVTPWSVLNMTLNSGYSTSETSSDEGDTTTSGSSLSATLSYTPTRKLYLSANLYVEPTPSQSFGLTWLPTRKIQGDARVGFSDEGTNVGGNLSWNPIQRLTMYTGYSYAVDEAGDERTETVYVRASLRL